MVSVDGFDYQVKDLYTRVETAFQQPWIVAVYILGQNALALHLWHGFDSSFQTLGLRYTRFGGAFKTIGRIYSIVVPLGFAIIPIYYIIFR